MVKRRENKYDVATLHCSDLNRELYLSNIDNFDEIKIYFKDQSEDVYTQVFGGTIRQAIPTLGEEGQLMTLLCKGYGAALEDTNCNRDYGLESSNPTLDKAQEIWQDLVDNFINKSLGSAESTGYAITKTKIANIASGTSIKYVNNPYRSNMDVVNLICELTTAIGGGSTAGGHWIVDNSKNLIINTIGAHENTTEWPDWWNTDQTNSTLTEGVDFTNYRVLDKSEEYANKVLLVTDFRRPAYDCWTENTVSSWGSEALDGLIADSSTKVVGTHAIRMQFGIAMGEAYYPSTEDAGWDVTKWGSEKTIPRLNFYFRANGDGTTAIGYLYLFTSDHNGVDSYYIQFPSISADTWYFHSIPIGPYWACAEESKTYPWTQLNDGDWANINGISFSGIKVLGTPYFWVDDLHFSGKIVRSAKDSTLISANNEYQKVLISRNAMDDSCVASDDTGFAGRIAHAELLRRRVLPTTIMFTVEGKPSMMGGQKAYIEACKKADGTYAIDTAMRIVEAQHELFVPNGFRTTVTATTDLKNTRAIGVPDQYAMWQENMFLNSEEARNIRSGAEVDLLIPILEKDYPS